LVGGGVSGWWLWWLGLWVWSSGSTKQRGRPPGKQAWAHSYSGMHGKLGRFDGDADCGVVLHAKDLRRVRCGRLRRRNPIIPSALIR